MADIVVTAEFLALGAVVAVDESSVVVGVGSEPRHRRHRSVVQFRRCRLSAVLRVDGEPYYSCNEDPGQGSAYNSGSEGRHPATLVSSIAARIADVADPTIGLCDDGRYG